jgi:NDP-sugar pyrophosphorylase family protein
MILSAGLGTRLKPLTDTVPKALIKIKDFTLLELQIKKLIFEGFNHIIINVHHFSDQIKIYLKQNNFFNCDISISDETNRLLDTGGGLKGASHFFSDGKPFLVYNVDIISAISLKRLMDYHFATGNLATLAVMNRKSSRKFLFDNANKLCGWMNEKTDEKIILEKSYDELIPYSFSGIQIIDPKLFKYFPDKNVFSLVDFYLSAAKNEILGSYIHNDDYWLDLGKIENIKKAEANIEKIRSIYRV